MPVVKLRQAAAETTVGVGDAPVAKWCTCARMCWAGNRGTQVGGYMGATAGRIRHTMHGRALVASVLWAVVWSHGMRASAFQGDPAKAHGEYVHAHAVPADAAVKQHADNEPSKQDHGQAWAGVPVAQGADTPVENLDESRFGDDLSASSHKKHHKGGKKHKRKSPTKTKVHVFATSTTPSTTTPTTTSSITATSTLQPGAGWTEFSFGAANTTVPTAFDIDQPAPVVLKIVDLMCAGDRFGVYDNGVFIGNTTSPADRNCTHVSEDAFVAYSSGNWSMFAQQLPSGNHTITMTVLESPFGSGTAAISTSPGYEECSLTELGLHVVTTPVSRAVGTDACTVLGMVPADINIYNFEAATRLVFNCVGAFKAAWIGSYWDNTYNDTCLALYTGNAVPGGAISVPASCTDPLPVICQRAPFYL